MVKINGEFTDAAAKPLLEVLLALGYDPLRIAVERNGDIVERSKYAHITLEDGDVLEVVSFVGGG